MSRISTVALQWLAVAGFVVNVCAYSPIQLVRDAHNIPHLSKNVFTTRTNSFHAANDDLKGYTVSVIILPIILGTMGIISLFVYQTILCCRACSLCTCRKNHEFGEQDVNKCGKGCKADCCPSWSYTNISVAFALCLFAAALCNTFVYIGDSQLEASFKDAADAIFQLGDIFQGISDSGTALETRTDILLLIVNSTQCEDTFDSPTEATIINNAETIGDAGENVADHVGGLPTRLDDYGDDIETDGDDNRKLVVNIYFAIIMGVILFYGIAPCFKSKAYLAFWTVILEIVILMLTIVAVVQMIIITVLGDFCMDPTGNIIYTADSGARYFDLLQYYFVGCGGGGTNPFQAAINNASDALEDLNQTVNDYVAANGEDECTVNVTNQINVLNRGLNRLTSRVSCQPIYVVYEEAVLNAVCRRGFRGLFIIWLTQWCTAGLLFFSLMVGASWFHFFNPGWDVPVSAEKHEVDEASYVAHTGVEMNNNDTLTKVSPSDPPAETPAEVADVEMNYDSQKHATETAKLMPTSNSEEDVLDDDV